MLTGQQLPLDLNWGCCCLQDVQRRHRVSSHVCVCSFVLLIGGPCGVSPWVVGELASALMTIYVASK